LKKNAPELTFEQALARLEEIVQALDTGELPLNDSLQLFEEGVKLARDCSKQLNEAKGKLEILVKTADGTLEAEPLEI
jgi:exodeoxyribonuclease VII small subunit